MRVFWGVFLLLSDFLSYDRIRLVNINYKTIVLKYIHFLFLNTILSCLFFFFLFVRSSTLNYRVCGHCERSHVCHFSL